MMQSIVRCLDGALLIEEDIAAVEHPDVPSGRDPAWGRYTDPEAGLLHGPNPSALCRPAEASYTQSGSTAETCLRRSPLPDMFVS